MNRRDLLKMIMGVIAAPAIPAAATGFNPCIHTPIIIPAIDTTQKLFISLLNGTYVQVEIDKRDFQFPHITEIDGRSLWTSNKMDVWLDQIVAVTTVPPDQIPQLP